MTRSKNMERTWREHGKNTARRTDRDDYNVSRTLRPSFQFSSVFIIKPPFRTRTDIAAWQSIYPGVVSIICGCLVLEKSNLKQNMFGFAAVGRSLFLLEITYIYIYIYIHLSLFLSISLCTYIYIYIYLFFFFHFS